MAGEVQHGRAGIDAGKAPLRVISGKFGQFLTAAGAEHQNLAIGGHMHGQKEISHQQQSVIARNLTPGAGRVGGDGGGIEKAVSLGSDAAGYGRGGPVGQG